MFWVMGSMSELGLGLWQLPTVSLTPDSGVAMRKSLPAPDTTAYINKGDDRDAFPVVRGLSSARKEVEPAIGIFPSPGTTPDRAESVGDEIAR